jgi:galactonate dehydratase
VRKGNRSVYPKSDMSVLVKVTTASGAVGWGETYGIVVPGAVTAIIGDLLGPIIVGRDPRDPGVIHEDLYDLMRVRGFFGGTMSTRSPASTSRCGTLRPARRTAARALLGGSRTDASRPMSRACPSRRSRSACRFAVEWIAKGFDAVKFAAAVSTTARRRRWRRCARRSAPRAKIMVDLHWRFTAPEASS